MPFSGFLLLSKYLYNFQWTDSLEKNLSDLAHFDYVTKIKEPCLTLYIQNDL